jgi:hypothetical protein
MKLCDDVGTGLGEKNEFVGQSLLAVGRESVSVEGDER